MTCFGPARVAVMVDGNHVPVCDYHRTMLIDHAMEQALPLGMKLVDATACRWFTLKRGAATMTPAGSNAVHSPNR